MKAGDAEQGVVDAVALESAVSLRPGEDVLDSGAYLLAGAFVLALPFAEFAVGGAAVRDDQPGAGTSVPSDRLRSGRVVVCGTAACDWSAVGACNERS